MATRFSRFVMSMLLMLTAVVALPTSAFAASSGCATHAWRANYAIKFNGNVDTTGYAKLSVHWCWANGEFNGINNQVTTQSCPGCTSFNKSNNNHDLLLNPYDRSIETDWNFLKLSCTFNLDLEIWLDNDTGGAAGKIRNVFASGATCAGWSIVVTSTA